MSTYNQNPALNEYKVKWKCYTDALGEAGIAHGRLREKGLSEGAGGGGGGTRELDATRVYLNPKGEYDEGCEHHEGEGYVEYQVGFCEFSG